MFKSADEVFITSSSGGVTAYNSNWRRYTLLINKYKDKKEQYATNCDPYYRTIPYAIVIQQSKRF